MSLPNDLSGDTELHLKARKNIVTGIARILRDISINSLNARGETPLIAAVQHGAVSVVEKLLANGADMNAVDQRGNTALHYAVYHCSPRIAILLCESQASVNIRNIYGKTPTHIATQHNLADLLQQLVKYAVNLDFSITDDEGYTPFLKRC